MSRPIAAFIVPMVLAAACGQVVVAHDPPTASTTNGVSAAGQVRPFTDEECPVDTGIDDASVTITCGSLVVPVDRAAPEATTTLSVVIYTPEETQHEVPMVYLHGGPGGGGILTDLAASVDLLVEPFLPIGPVVVFDQRGAGLSEPPPACERLWVVDSQLTGADEENSLVGDLFLQLAPDCRDRIARAGMQLEHYHSIANAADVADLAATLEFDQINLYGGSYGSRLAQTILREYPDLVRAAALTGVYPATVDLSDGTSRGFVEAFNEVASSCAANEQCNDAYPDLQGSFARGYDQLERSPIELTFGTESGRPFLAKIDGDDYASMVFSMLYDAEAVASLPSLMAQVEERETDQLWRYFDWYGFATATDFWQVYASVLCSDEVSLRTTEFETPNRADRFLAADLLPGLHGRLLNELCETWPHTAAPTAESTLIRTSVPILLITGLFDPITPASWATALHEQLPTSRLVLLPHRGHGVVDDYCIRQLLAEFLDNPAVPVDPSCADREISFRTDVVGEPTLERQPFSTIEGEPYELDAPSNWLGYWLDGGSIFYRDRDHLDETAIMFALSNESGAAEAVVVENIDLPEAGAETLNDGWDTRRRFESVDRLGVALTRSVEGVEYAFGYRTYAGDDAAALDRHLEAMFDSVVRP